MSIEDVDYMKKNSYKENYTFLVDSRLRDKNLYPEPNEYVINFEIPFKNVFGIEILDITIPKTMYNIDVNTNNFILYFNSNIDPLISYDNNVIGKKWETITEYDNKIELENTNNRHLLEKNINKLNANIITELEDDNIKIDNLNTINYIKTLNQTEWIKHDFVNTCNIINDYNDISYFKYISSNIYFDSNILNYYMYNIEYDEFIATLNYNNISNIYCINNNTSNKTDIFDNKLGLIWENIGINKPLNLIEIINSNLSNEIDKRNNVNHSNYYDNYSYINFYEYEISEYIEYNNYIKANDFYYKPVNYINFGCEWIYFTNNIENDYISKITNYILIDNNITKYLGLLHTYNILDIDTYKFNNRELNDINFDLSLLEYDSYVFFNSPFKFFKSDNYIITGFNLKNNINIFNKLENYVNNISADNIDIREILTYEELNIYIEETVIKINKKLWYRCKKIESNYYRILDIDNIFHNKLENLYHIEITDNELEIIEKNNLTINRYSYIIVNNNYYKPYIEYIFDNYSDKYFNFNNILWKPVTLYYKSKGNWISNKSLNNIIINNNFNSNITHNLSYNDLDFNLFPSGNNWQHINKNDKYIEYINYNISNNLEKTLLYSIDKINAVIHSNITVESYIKQDDKIYFPTKNILLWTYSNIDESSLISSNNVSESYNLIDIENKYLNINITDIDNLHYLNYIKINTINNNLLYYIPKYNNIVSDTFISVNNKYYKFQPEYIYKPLIEYKTPTDVYDLNNTDDYNAFLNKKFEKIVINIEKGNYTLNKLIVAINNKFSVINEKYNYLNLNLNCTGASDPIDLTNILKFTSDRKIIFDMNNSTIDEILGFYSITNKNNINYQYININNNNLYNKFFHSIYDTNEYIIAPGMVNLLGTKYIILKSPEIEDHLYGSFSYTKNTLGLGKIKLTSSGLNEEKNTFYKLKLKEFHPIGKLSKMTFKFVDYNNELYNFRGINHDMIIAIHYYSAVQTNYLNKSIINPEYNMNFIDYKYNKPLNNDDDDDDASYNIYKKKEEVYNRSIFDNGYDVNRETDNETSDNETSDNETSDNDSSDNETSDNETSDNNIY